MGLLQDKFAKYDLPQQFMAKGVYPYFRTINSHQDTEVTMDGKKVLMFGSNAYLGLTYDIRIIDASFAATEKYAVAMVPGDHGTTYGGNPLATAAICEVFHQYDKLHILDHVNEIAPYLTEKLETLAEAHPDKVKEVRGLGLMQGMELTIPAGDVVAKALQAGVVLISAGTNIIRFVPPLIVEKEHIDKMINVLDDVLSE